MTCPFCHHSFNTPVQETIVTRSQNGRYVPYPYPPHPYGEPPIITGTTEEILKLRSGVIAYEEEERRRAKGIYHWANVPSGSEISRDFQRNFPNVVGDRKPAPLNPLEGFPYPYTAPYAPPPNPHLNLGPPPQRPVYRPASGAVPQAAGATAYRAAGGCGGKVQQALQHVDAAARILKNY
ncbi:hypothetical protein M9Y10_042481 [Tritrichomonas musculus]|uniref:Uncharacterized protein n=1 Tax=Tritrichomonas musculus TaxID=1915356 RepID=A0ABR2GQS7_9EUKA